MDTKKYSFIRSFIKLAITGRFVGVGKKPNKCWETSCKPITIVQTETQIFDHHKPNVDLTQSVETKNWIKRKWKNSGFTRTRIQKKKMWANFSSKHFYWILLVMCHLQNDNTEELSILQEIYLILPLRIRKQSVSFNEQTTRNKRSSVFNNIKIKTVDIVLRLTSYGLLKKYLKSRD